jgi:prepilin signal peptidase PulO-like enzyme (type II secretory pathway)
MLLLFALLPLFYTEPAALLLNSLYIAVLILVIVTDLEHRLIFHAVTFPATFWAIIGSFFLADNTWWLALGGAAAGFLIFYIFYWLGRLLFGPGALGFGDVTLSMMMGAMLGFHRIIFTLVLGIFIGGIFSLLLVLSRRANRRMKLPYGPYLAIAGIIMLIWGMQFLEWYAG